MKRLYSAPTTVNLELTELCNVKCRHCYNFWRDESMGSVSLDTSKIDKLVEKFVEARVFHVILSGGEPFATFDILEYAIRQLQANNISVSCNSNLMLATDDRIVRLLDAGLDHILTSIPSCDPATNDYIMSQIGAFERIVGGIECATRNGMRVSANMVITRRNKNQVYETGKLVAGLGCQKLFVTRAVPPTYSDTSKEDDYSLTPDEVKTTLDDALRVKEDFGIMIGSLISYPLCFLGDLEKYADFVGRGCPSQRGDRMSINANGDLHVCVHEEEGYGNIFESSIQEIFQTKMRKWHNGSFHYEGCEGCEYLDVCESGCSMMALGQYGAHEAKDPLFVGPDGIYKPFKLVNNPAVYEAIDRGAKFTAPKRLRFRQEDGFYLLNIRWGNSITVPNEIAEFLIEYRDSGEEFTIEEFGRENREALAGLFFKDAVECKELRYDDLRSMAGLSINPEALPSIAAA